MPKALEITGIVTVGAALAGPALFTQPSPPSASFETNVTSFIGWGLWLAWLGWVTRHKHAGVSHRRPTPAAAWAAFGVLALLAAAAVASSALAGWPSRLLAPPLAALVAASIALWAGLRAGHCSLSPDASEGPRANGAVELFLWALVLTGAANAVLAIAQFAGAAEWWPGLMPPGRDGRPGGHFRHPSLLGTWLIWSVCGLVTLRALKCCRPRVVCGLGVLLLAGIVVSGSRTAALCSLLLAGWGALDRQLDRRARVALLVAPVIVLLGWLLLVAWSQAGNQTFAGAAVIQKADLSSSRGRLWQQAWVLIQNDPLTGVGFGQFNFAWTLTPMVDLPRVGGHTFTHAHNLFVHWAVELGLPLTLVLAALISASLLGALRASFTPPPAATIVGRSAFVMVIVVLLHSQLEYPLWHVHFLLPTAFLWGLALAGARTQATSPVAAAPSAPPVGHVGWRGAAASMPGLAVAAVGIFAMQQFAAISQVYRPSGDAPADDVRIARAQHSWLYGHLADRLTGTLAPRGQRELAPFGEVVFEMLDPSLMTAWASAHDENCKQARAEYLRDRMREFGWSTPPATPVPSVTTGSCPPDVGVLTFRSFR